MLLSNILQALSGTINNIYIGQILGVQAMAAVSGFFPVAFFCVSFIIGLGAGSSVLIGQAWGARDTGRVKAVAGTALCVALLLGLDPAHTDFSAQAQQDNALREQLQTLGLPYRVVYGAGPARLVNALLALGLPAPDADAQQTREQAQFDLNRGRTPWSCEKCSDPECEHKLFTGLLLRP